MFTVDNRLLSKLRVAHAHDIQLVVCIWVALRRKEGHRRKRRKKIVEGKNLVLEESKNGRGKEGSNLISGVQSLYD